MSDASQNTVPKHFILPFPFNCLTKLNRYKRHLKIILDVMYVDYSSALEICGLQTLHKRREQRCMTFALKCLKTPTIKEIFPLNPTEDTYMIRVRKRFKVNKYRTEFYRNSAIPYLQRRLNSYFSKAKVRSRKEARAGGSVCGKCVVCPFVKEVTQVKSKN